MGECGHGHHERQQQLAASTHQRVATDEQQEEEGEAAENGIALLSLRPRVRAEAILLVIGEASDFDLFGREERLWRLAVGAGKDTCVASIVLGQQLIPWSLFWAP